VVVKEVKLWKAVERCLAKAIFRWQRQRAKGLGVRGEAKNGDVSFT